MLSVAGSVLLRPEPLWASSVAVLERGRTALVDPVHQALWIYEPDGTGTQIDDVRARRVGRVAGGSLWVEDVFGGLLELGEDFAPRRRVRLAGRWDERGAELVGLDCWVLEPGSGAVLGLAETVQELAVVRVPLDSATSYQVLVEVQARLCERRFWALGLPYLTLEHGRILMATLGSASIHLVDLLEGGSYKRLPGGLGDLVDCGGAPCWSSVLGQTARLSFAGLLGDGEHAWTLHRQGGFYFLERASDDDVELAVRSTAARMVGAVAGDRGVLLELGLGAGGSLGTGRLIELERERAGPGDEEMHAVWRQAFHELAQGECPQVERLEQLRQESLEPEEREEVVTHMCGCGRCRAMLFAVSREEREAC